MWQEPGLRCEQGQGGEYDGPFNQYETLGEDVCYEGKTVRPATPLDIYIRFRR